MWRARVTSYANNAFSVDLETSHMGLLVLSEMYYPGWKAYLDGREMEIYRADYNLRAVLVPKGRHTMEMRFEPATFTRGMVVTLVSLLVCGAGIVAPVVRSRAPGVKSSAAE